jgi:Chaperone for flagella basal body P-ring formation
LAVPLYFIWVRSFMKLPILTAFLIAVSVLPSLSSGQIACDAVVAANIEVAKAEFSLADLLATSTCPALRRAASRVRLGKAPLPGSVRVLAGDEVRAYLHNVTANVENSLGWSANLRVPERVSVRRAGARANCADIFARIFAPHDAHPEPIEPGRRDLTTLDAGEALPLEPDCGAAGRIALEAALELTKKTWNPALVAWDVYARCLDPGDCVPFLVRVPARDFPAKSAAAARMAAPLRFAKAPIAASHQTPLVRPGETVSLLWDQDGIRLVVPAVSLDAGRAGAEVRARVGRGGRTVRGIVVGPGKLRAAP